MRILICHGYLLKGTGSNMCVQSIARALCRQGHNIIVMCQESEPDLDFVSTFLREVEGHGVEVVWERSTGYPGTCMVFKGDIGGLLPVYVMDAYPGFQVKTFVDLTSEELEEYVARNRATVERLVRQFVPEMIQTNHAVMLPAIVRPVAEAAGVPYCVSIHGSEIDFAVKKDPRYLPYGEQGLAGATRVFAPSEHTGRQVLETFGEVEGLGDLMEIIPLGVDTELFAPRRRPLRESVDLLLEAVRSRTAGVTVGDFRREPSESGDAPAGTEEEIAGINAAHPAWLPDADLASRLQEIASGGNPFVMFLGKLLETKGVQCAIPALPLVLADHPDARLVLVGFGELRGMLELMLAALDSGDIEEVRRLCSFGDMHYTRVQDGFGPVLSFLDRLAVSGEMERYRELCLSSDLHRAVVFAGYLAPEEHSMLLPHSRAMLAPSIASEAFGLVAVEAMAAGVTPIATCHSGLATAVEPAREAWGDKADVLLLRDPDRMVEELARACGFVLDADESLLREKGALMRQVVKERFSWDAVARRMLAECQ